MFMEDGSRICDGSGTTSTTIIGERGSFGSDDWNNACSTIYAPPCAGLENTNGLFVDHQSAGPFEVHTSLPLTHTVN